ncbi:MAG: ABC-F family ATP-binding cassette domain-containing protein [Clostridia bacterium]|nr:ABC-F family ATP-binding cassette domain-containing protein [Clostridia bacterium]
MTIISVNDLCLSFGPKDLLQNISFSLEHNDRLGIVGPNGCGKSTMLSLLLGREEPTSGTIYIAKETTVGILTQEGAFEVSEELGTTALEQMYGAFPELISAERRLDELSSWLERHADESDTEKHASITREYSELHDRYVRDNGLVFRSRCRSILERMGFDPSAMDQRATSLSGGQRTRLALSRQLCREPDILMLDEPTNHLDAETLGWLENYLSTYSKCIIVVSHDRRFLDRVTNKTLLIEHKHAKLYRGGYTACAEQRKTDREIYEKHYRDQQKEIARQEAYIEQQRRWNRERNIIAAESRQKLLDKMDKLAAPEKDEKTVQMRFTCGIPSGNDVIELRHVGFSYAIGSRLLQDVNFKVKRGERVFIVGPNGCGKSTLINLLMEKLHPTSGVIDFGHNLQIGYYDQENQNLNEENTVLEELWGLYPTMKEHEARGALGAFLFRGDDVFKTVSVLSGGERARLTLVKLMLSKMNTLILDEPTNHLDIGSREALEDALTGFEGTLICVSHDRAFIDALATRIIGFDSGHHVYDMQSSAPGKAWEEWMTYCSSAAGEGAGSAGNAGNNGTSSAAAQPNNKELYLRSKREAAEARKAAARLERLRHEQTELEAELEKLNAELYGDAASDYIRAAEINDRIEKVEERLLEIYEETEE